MIYWLIKIKELFYMLSIYPWVFSMLQRLVGECMKSKDKWDYLLNQFMTYNYNHPHQLQQINKSIVRYNNLNLSIYFFRLIMLKQINSGFLIELKFKIIIFYLYNIYNNIYLFLK